MSEPLSSRSENETAEQLREQRDALREYTNGHLERCGANIADLNARLEAAEGERDRWASFMRNAPDNLALVEAHIANHPDVAEEMCRNLIRDARAALSTGDRQEQHFGGTGAEVPQTGNDGHETEGGVS